MRIRIATRGSRLALWQAHRVAGLLEERGHQPELVTIRTTGDRRTDVPLAAIGGKGMFIKELEEALLADHADVAVHSLKDVPSILPPAFMLAAFPEREDPRDAWLQPDGRHPGDLPAGSIIATGSPRRQAQIRSRWSHLEVVGVRGNVDTRLNALSEHGWAGMVLAMAGLRRLDLAGDLRAPMSPEEMIPAAGQGILALEILKSRGELRESISQLSDPLVEREARAERRVLELFGNQLDCHSPIAVHASHEGAALRIRAFAGTPDGSASTGSLRAGAPEEWEAVAAAVHEDLRSSGALEMMNRGIE